MALRKIRLQGDEVLAKVSRPVEKMTPRIHDLIGDMLETMYDAMGVRRAAGEQAKVLNKIVFQWGDVVKKDSPEKESSKKADSSEELAKKELKEFLGHTPLEVLGGALLGILIAMFFPVM